MQDMEMAGVDADKKSYRSMISSCRRKPAQYAQYALDAFERLKWRYEDIVGVDMYALIIEVLWGSRRIRDVFSLLDECEDAQLCSRAWSLARACCRAFSFAVVSGCVPPITRRAARSVSSSVVTASRRSSSVTPGSLQSDSA